MTNIMESCVGKILSFLVEPAITHGAYVIQYKNQVQLLEQESKRLGEKKERIEGMVDRATNIGEVIETEVSSWLEKVEEMEGNITNFLNQPEDGESFRCFPGCMCPNLMWRHKRGMEAEERKLVVSELISRGELLQTSPVTRDASFQSELHFDSSQYYTMFQSRASVVEEIKNALKDSGVDLIGVHGPGGAGKTTMVTEVAKEAKKLGIFDKFVIAVVSKDPNTSKLQEELASQLDFNYKHRSEIGRADELRKAMLNSERRILVILDDLWQVLGLNAIGIPTSGLGDRGCKILLTSRDEEVLRRMEVHSCVRLGYLEEQETWKLFRKVTGDFGVDDSTARKVSERCGGLPIAIVAVGAALKGKEEAEWQDALHQLENCRIKYIEGSEPLGYTPLKWSYDFLKEEDAKSCFLLCCLFPEDAEISIDDLVRYSFALGFLRKVDTLKVARNRVQAMVNMLKRSCLLLNGENKNFVKMHDIIRDLAISITWEKQIKQGGGHDWPGQQQFIVNHNIKEWPKNDAWEHHTAISLRINNDQIRFPSGVLHCPLMHALVLESEKSSPKIPEDFFQGMKEARVLDFKKMFFELPSSVLELDHLRMLRLNNCELLGDLSTIQNLKNHIEILSFEGSIKELPQEMEKLTRLRSLDLRHCWLKVIPKGVISNLIHLEELYVTHMFKKWDTTIEGGGMSNASIAELKSLNQLTVLHVGISTNSCRIMMQECRYLFEKLINFSIFIGDGPFYHVGSPNVLEIVDIHRIDEFRLLMDRVEKMGLSKIQDLRYLYGKPQREFTPSSGGSFCKLSYLSISGCHSMIYLFSPSCAKAFQQLKTLRIYNCRIMEQIIGVGDHCNEEEVVTDEAIIFSQLGMIHLSLLPQFRSFCPKMEKATIEGNPSNWTTMAESIFNEKVSFPVLQKLTIDKLPAKYIWNKQMIQFPKESNKVSFSQLKHIKVIQCHKLVNVFPSNILLQLQNLEALRVQNCHSLTLLVEDLNANIQNPTVKFKLIDVFPKLRDLELDSLPKLMKIWLNNKDYYSNDHLYLKTLSITNCGSLRHAFPAFVVGHLAWLDVQACPGMEVIVSEASGEGVTDDGIIKFSQLKALKLVDLPNLNSFSQFKSDASHLFNHQVSFPILEDLTISVLSMEDIWNKQMIQSPKGSNKVSFFQLKSMEVAQCHNLVNVFPSNMLSRLQNLETLCVRDCPSLKLLVEDLNPIIQSTTVKFKLIDEFPKLRDLELNSLPKLIKIWFNDEDYCSNDNDVHLYLKTISIRYCDSLRHAFSAFVVRHLACIEQLHVQACPGMEVIVSRGKGVTDDGIMKFCQLKTLNLVDLPNLKSFYQSKSEVSHLFNHEVTFPKIKYLHLSDLKTLRKIQLWDLLATTQEHLHIVSIFGCQVSTKVSSHHQKRISRTIIDNLVLRNCQGVKHVIDLNGTIEQFVDVKRLELHDLPELVLLWNKNLHEIGGFRSLKNIIIRDCSQLGSLFTLSMAMSLQHLEMLSVECCEMMEEIIIIEENNINFTREGMATRHIEFPKLKRLTLLKLPNFKNFCNDKRGSFSFSSLSIIDVWCCQKMKTFASGQICLAPGMIRVKVGKEEVVEITDLNAFFESRNEDNNYMMITIN
ncbi:probable disease resistance protein At4g27220 [Diospyros lotus]|uniref:probable disease resistance protein At4g27220 n=1 Tax=Diospyros lotus TaxID=55363 RepID=UPI00224D3A1C|nr:probable disease resistance protein At4g27220 [Diospyros lotus]